MISDIVIENFQSHKRTELKLKPGINIITGPTDAGKSAIFRALQWWAFNHGGTTESWRHGSDFTQVTGNNVIRRRSPKENSYQVNGKVFKAVRQEVPQEVEASLQLSEINFQGQHQAYFLISDSDTPGKVAKTLNQVADLQIIDDVIKTTKQKLKEARTRKFNLQSSLINLKERIDGLSWLKIADREYREIEKIEKIIESYDLEALTDVIKDVVKCQREFDHIPAVSGDIQTLDVLKMKLKSYHSTLELIQDVLNNQVFIPETADDLSAVRDIMFHLNTSHLTSLDTMITDYECAKAEVSWYPEVIDVPDSLLEEYQTLKEQILSLSTLIDEVVEAEDALDVAERSYMEERQMFQIKLKELKVCPLCGSSEGFQEYV